MENDMEEPGCEEGKEAFENQAPGLRKEARGFAGGVTLGEVKEALGEPKESLLCQENKAGKRAAPGAGEGGGASGWKVFPPDDMQRTLTELSLKDGDALLVLEPQSFDSSVFTLSGDVVTVTTPSECRWLQVEYQPQRSCGAGQKEEEPKKVKVLAAGNTLLCEVKQRALERLQELEQGPLEGAQYCLRQVDCTGKLLPPVCEELSVREAGVRLMTTLTLCLGHAPKASQLFLNFSVGAAPSAGMEMDTIVEKTCTVKECLSLMLERVGLDGTSWQLRKLDWCEEVGEPLMDEDASLSELNISNGETLIITEGQLPPKGFLKLSVWLYVNQSRHCADNGYTEEFGGNSLPLCSSSAAELMDVGSVEISDEVTLEDLKTQMLTLPALVDMCVPTSAFLRVWQLEGRRLARVLRGPQLTLRKLKLSSGADLCVQQLLKEEDLGPKEVVLTVKMGVPGESCYYPSEELVWDASRDSSPRSLRTCLTAHYGLSPDSLLLAKFQPEKYSWEEICSWNQQISKKKKKKRTESLLGAPFHLKDGDTIGIKNLLIDNNRDFCTLEDKHYQMMLREQAELNKGGQAAGAEPRKKGGQAKSRKPEVALSISVGEFR